jgi:hypothetical protein
MPKSNDQDRDQKREPEVEQVGRNALPHLPVEEGAMRSILHAFWSELMAIAAILMTLIVMGVYAF